VSWKLKIYSNSLEKFREFIDPGMLANSPRRLLHGNKTICLKLDISDIQWDTIQHAHDHDEVGNRGTWLLRKKHGPDCFLLMSRCRVFRSSHANFSRLSSFSVLFFPLSNTGRFIIYTYARTNSLLGDLNARTCPFIPWIRTYARLH